MQFLPNFIPKNLRIFKVPAINVPSTSRSGARPNGISLRSKQALNNPSKVISSYFACILVPIVLFQIECLRTSRQPERI